MGPKFVSVRPYCISKVFGPPDNAYTRSLSVKIPNMEDFDKWLSVPLLQIIKAPILFLFINDAASNRSEFSEIVKISQN